MRTAIALAALATTLAAGTASAQTVVLTANLTGAQENPPVNTPATGTATLTIDLATRAWSLSLSFGTLVAPLTISHIHRAPIGVNGPVIIGLDGLPLGGGQPVWALVTPGITSFNSGGPQNAPFPFPAAELPNLLAGNTYVNVHSQTFPGGEIRGQLVPTPGAIALLSLAGLAAARRRRA